MTDIFDRCSLMPAVKQPLSFVRLKRRTILAGAKAAAWEAEAVAALQQQHMGDAVVRHQQHRFYAAPSTLLRIPVAQDCAFSP